MYFYTVYFSTILVISAWQEIYALNMSSIPLVHGMAAASKLLGGEALLWTRNVDEFSIHSRLWPRLAAMAEVFWSQEDKKGSRRA